jgi:hypothetical protein
MVVFSTKRADIWFMKAVFLPFLKIFIKILIKIPIFNTDIKVEEMALRTCGRD